MILYKKIVLLCLLSTIVLGGCMKKSKQDPYEQGQVVTWKLWGEMIIQAELGERRLHSPNNHSERGEKEFYHPEKEHYLGQFPIDYQPKPFPRLTKEESLAMPIKPILAGKALEFNLMLNGSWVQATDRNVIAKDTLDHPDQVKVIVNPNNIKYTTKEAYLKSTKEPKGKYEREISEKNQLHCLTEDNISLVCYGESTHENISGIILSSWDNNKVKAISYERTYGGIVVEWYFHRNNLEHWKNIDRVIWQLIHQWNISSFSS